MPRYGSYTRARTRLPEPPLFPSRAQRQRLEASRVASAAALVEVRRSNPERHEPDVDVHAVRYSRRSAGAARSEVVHAVGRGFRQQSHADAFGKQPLRRGRGLPAHSTRCRRRPRACGSGRAVPSSVPENDRVSVGDMVDAVGDTPPQDRSERGADEEHQRNRDEPPHRLTTCSRLRPCCRRSREGRGGPRSNRMGS